MWSAHKFAGDAQRLEARGQENEARAQWARAAVKAESVLARHPESGWADDALVLRADALSRSGNCRSAAEPIAKALASIREPALRERAGLAAARCALEAGEPGAAGRLLAEALASTDAQRRSDAEYLAGRAAAARFDYEAATRHYRASRAPAALTARVRTLIAVGRREEAAAVLDTVAAARFAEAEWAALLDELAAASGAGLDAARALDRMLERGRVPFAARARLLLADGDRRLSVGDRDGAGARYAAAIAAAPAAPEADVARVRLQRVRAARATTRDALALVVADVARLLGLTGAGGVAEARQLHELLVQIGMPPLALGPAFRGAELARDSLGAPTLAGHLFLDIAAADPGSIFAPKALLAALPLLPDRRDSLLGVLESAHAASPYTRALRGEPAPAYAAAEDSLARVLGVKLTRPALATAARVALPVPGPRGPWLEAPPALRPRPDEPGPRAPVTRPREERPARPERP